MVDIQSELQSARIGFESKYITLFDVIEALKNESDATYSEIAQYLLLKILPYEPLPDRRFELDTGLDAYRYFQFTNSDYLMPYETPKKLYYVSIEHAYFEEVKDALKMLEAFDDIPVLNGAVTSKNHIRVEYKNKTYDSNPFSMSGYKSICFEIEDMKRILELDFSEYKTKGVVFKIENYCNASLEDDVSCLSSSPIENSIEIVSQNEEIARLKEEIAELKKAQTAGKIQQERISQPQRDLFTLLVMNCYGERQSRNDLFNAINADLRAKGIRTSEVKYSTFDKLIDNEIRINNKSPFPPKQK